MLVADQLMQNPRTYATALLWLLSELFERLPEVGDVDKPKLVFFFDEAHLLFDDIPKALEDKIEQVVRLIRSKGVGVYFVTQNPLDIPETVLGQLGNRVQHALRAFTPRDQKAVKSAAETFRQNPEAQRRRSHHPARRRRSARLACSMKKASPASSSAPSSPRRTASSRPSPPPSAKQIIEARLLYGTYETAVDRESAAEKLQARAGQRTAEAPPAAGPKPLPGAAPGATSGGSSFLKDLIFGSTGPRGGRREGIIESVAKSTARSVGREIMRGVLGGIFGGSKRR